MNLSDLEGASGDAVELLGVERGTDGIADLSSANWSSSHVVLRGLRFDHVRISGTFILPVFADCEMVAVSFADVQAVTSFWGWGNHWIDCEFARVEMRDMVSPEAVFTRCSFVDTDLTHYGPDRTVFEHCRFERTRLRGVRVAGGRRHTDNDVLRRLGVSLGFTSCVFREARFENCYLEGVGFERCGFEGVGTSGTSFAGIVSDQTWWTEQDDPYATYLRAYAELAARKLGEGSKLYIAISAYRDAYNSGETNERDVWPWFDRFEVPADELFAIDSAVMKLMSDFGMM